MTDIKSLKREAVRVWDQISLDVVDNCVQDFYPRLRACDALAGAALNQHKFVLRAFRRSSSDGMLALAESTTERLQITLFCDASRDFFRDEAPKHVPMRKLPPVMASPTRSVRTGDYATRVRESARCFRRGSETKQDYRAADMH